MLSGLLPKKITRVSCRFFPMRVTTVLTQRSSKEASEVLILEVSQAPAVGPGRRREVLRCHA